MRTLIYIIKNKKCKNILRNIHISIVAFFYKNRVYHYHIRKTGGTSINFAFLRLAKPKKVSFFYEKLAKKPNHRLIKNGKIFVGWNKNLIETGRYYYAFSHIPAHELNIPKYITKITCFRDPVKRVISHYNMIKYYKTTNNKHIAMNEEFKWLGSSFDDFLVNIPKKHLLRQLYMFSKNYDINEALNFIKENKIEVLFTELLNSDMEKISNKLNIKLVNYHEKKYDHKEKIEEQDMIKLRNMLKDEYIFIDKILQINE